MKAETREYGEYLLRISNLGMATRYTLAGKKQLLDIVIFDDGRRSEWEGKKKGAA